MQLNAANSILLLSTDVYLFKMFTFIVEYIDFIVLLQ